MDVAQGGAERAEARGGVSRIAGASARRFGDAHIGCCERGGNRSRNDSGIGSGIGSGRHHSSAVGHRSNSSARPDSYI